MEWRRYVPVAARRAKALREMNKLRKKGRDIQPIEIEGRTIARSFWGKRWCKHLESFSDYANRLPRGRTYVRNGSVCHLAIRTGRIDAIVSGSELYDVTIRIDKLKPAVWKSVRRSCSGQIGSMLELLQGKLSQQVMSVVTDRERGLFPKPGEIRFDCSCPDWASMCKHVASVLYGVGSRLDDHPESLFLLRGVDTSELIATEMTLPGEVGTEDALADDALAGIFGIDLDTGVDTGIDADTGDGAGGDAGDASPPAPKAPARRSKRAGRRTTGSAPERQAQSVSRDRKRPVSTVSAKRTRKTASGTVRAKKASPAAVPRTQTATRAGDLPALAKSTGRARKTASSAARGKTPSPPPPKPRQRTAAKARDAPAAGTTSSRDIRPTGKWVARLRRRSGLSVAGFAAELGVTAMTVYRWEAMPGPLTLRARPLNALMAFHQQSGKSGKSEKRR